MLRVLIIVNVVASILALALLILLPNERWIVTALGLSPSLGPGKVAMALRLMGLLGLVFVALNHVILKRLLAIVDTVRAGDPFVASNARRLQIIARALLGLQILSLAIAAAARTLSTPDHPVNLDAGFSINGWLAVLLTFLLARVFAEGSAMRDDLEGTV